MIDSINFKVKVPYNYLNIPKFIKVKPIPNKRTNFFTRGIKFDYKGIKFQYYDYAETLLIYTTAHKVLKKRDITLKDYDEYMKRLNNILSEFYDIKIFKTKLVRLDYCVDLQLGKELIDIYLNIFKHNKRKYKYMKMKKKYDSSIYLKTRRGKTNLNIYDRFAKTHNEKDKGILRIELQQKEYLIKKTGKTLKDYWNISKMEMFYFDFLKGYFYIGNHYKLDDAIKMIDTSNITENKKEKLKQFLKDIMKSNLSDLKGYTINKTNSRIKLLDKLEINPLCIPKYTEYDELENLLHMAHKVAEEKYFD